MIAHDASDVWWSGMETPGMIEAKCSLLIQEEADYDAKIKALPRQRVRVYQDRGLRQSSTSTSTTMTTTSSSSSVSDPRLPSGDVDNRCNSNSNTNNNHHDNTTNDDDDRVVAAAAVATGGAGGETPATTTSFDVDFAGATILQLEPVIDGPQRTMPVTITVGGRCVFTPENFQDFQVMMRTRQQSVLMEIAPNGNFDWPDVMSLLLCPVCGRRAPQPRQGDGIDHEYWMVFYPLLQISVNQGSELTLATRTICRLTCLPCMEDVLLEGLALTIQPGGRSGTTPMGTPDLEGTDNKQPQQAKRLCFTLPASDVLAEAGSASFLEDGPARPETHPHVDDILDAWTLYNLWEHSGAWEALQNDYRIVLDRSMRADPSEVDQQQLMAQPRLKDRMGRPCGNPQCNKVHGTIDTNGEMVRLVFKCRACNSEYYCSKACRESDRMDHQEDCIQRQNEREERRERRAKKVQCDTCQRRFPYTKMKKCSRCRKATYCSVDCQRLDWQRHRDVCS